MVMDDAIFFSCSDKELNVCTRMPHQRVLDKFRSAIFQEPPANSGICTGMDDCIM